MGETYRKDAAARRGVQHRARNEEGFALAVVVFLLFAIAVAAATGYRIVRTEAQLSIYSADGAKALFVAQSGVQQLLATRAPDLSGPVTLQIDDGEARLSARRVSEFFPNEVLLLTSRGSFADPRFANVPARRTVRQYVRHHRAPLDVLAAVASSGTIEVNSTGPPGQRFHMSGSDDGSCPGAPRNVPPLAPGVTASEVSVPWHVLTDPSFPVDAEVTSLSSSIEDYPVTRVNGDLVTSGAVSGTGILIVTGSMHVAHNFLWHGIILIGGSLSMDFPGMASHRGVHGVMVAGLDGTSSDVDLERGRLTYNSCEVLRAGAPLARLEPFTNTWWEVH